MPEHLPGAASTSVHALLHEPERPAEILASFDRAVYLRLAAHADRDGSGSGEDVVAVLTADALRLPGSVVLAASRAVRARRLLPRMAGGGSVTVGGGRVQLPGLTVLVTRWWRPRTPRVIRPSSRLRRRADALEPLLPRLPAELADPVHALARALRSCRVNRKARLAARQLVGLGPGLTPAGDDVLAGLLLTLSSGPPTARRVAEDLAAEVIPDAPRRTTALSAALLRQAASREGLPQVIDLLDAVTDDRPGKDGHLTTALSRLLDVGSSSGVALAHGVLVGTATMTSNGRNSGSAPMEVTR